MSLIDFKRIDPLNIAIEGNPVIPNYFRKGCWEFESQLSLSMWILALLYFDIFRLSSIKFAYQLQSEHHEI